MAEAKHSGGGGLGLGVIFFLIVLGVFIIWVLTGGPTGSKSVIKTKDTTSEKTPWPLTSEIDSYGTDIANPAPTWPPANQIPPYQGTR
jgi:hypothetical protein